MAANAGSNSVRRLAQARAAHCTRFIFPTVHLKRCVLDLRSSATDTAFATANLMCSYASGSMIAGSKSSRSRSRDPETDEYSDDDDPGYTRQDIRGQEAFIARELDLSDDNTSHCGPVEFHSPSKKLHEPDSSSTRDSSHMAEPASTSAYESEGLSEMSQSTIQPSHAGTEVSHQLSITLKPGLADVSKSDQDAGHLVAPDSHRSDQSAESSASLTITDRTRTDPEEQTASTLATDEAVVNTANPTGTSLVHQQSGFRYLLDGMLEKVSDAFGRHSPRSGAQGDGSEHSAESLSEGGDMNADDQASGMPTLRTYHR